MLKIITGIDFSIVVYSRVVGGNALLYCYWHSYRCLYRHLSGAESVWFLALLRGLGLESRHRWPCRLFSHVRKRLMLFEVHVC